MSSPGPFLSIGQCLITDTVFLCIVQCPVLVPSLYWSVSNHSHLLCIIQCTVTVLFFYIDQCLVTVPVFLCIVQCPVPVLSLYQSVSSPCPFSISSGVQSLSFLCIIQYPVPVLSLYHSVSSPCPSSVSFSFISLYWSVSSHSHCLSLYCSVSSPCPFSVSFSVQPLSFFYIGQCLVTVTVFLCIFRCPVPILYLYYSVSFLCFI